MPIEVASNISQLVATNPNGTDMLSTVDNHIRLLKSTLQTTFPSITGLATQAEAEAGTSTTKVTTPLSVKQAILANEIATTAGTYTKLTVDTRGRITATTNITWADMPANPALTGSVSITATTGNPSVEFGRIGTANTPYIDFHSGATATDYDSRIMASGGTATLGMGTLNYYAAQHVFNGSASFSGQLVLNADLSATSVSGNAVATQSEATAGTAVNKIMTPLRTAQAISSQISSFAIGVDQNWYDFTSTRVRGTSYQNTTGRPILVNVSTDGGTDWAMLQVSTDNTNWIVVANGITAPATMSAIIPNNYYYRAYGTDGLKQWAELR